MYNSVLDMKVDWSNKIYFCENFISILCRFFGDDSIIHVHKILDDVIIAAPFNKGFSSYNNLIYNSKYRSIFLCCNNHNSAFDMLNLNDILANIEIIINCIYLIPDFNDYRDNIGHTLINLCDNFIKDNGYIFLKDNDNIFKIIKKDLPIDVTKVNDQDLKTDILNYFDFANEKNLKIKKSILINLALELYGKRTIINKIMGKDMANIFCNYVNNVDIRHPNRDIYSNDYIEIVANLTEEELIHWYDYVYSLALVIYDNLDKLKDIKISTRCK